jgi:hypothetical protein
VHRLTLAEADALLALVSVSAMAGREEIVRKLVGAISDTNIYQAARRSLRQARRTAARDLKASWRRPPAGGV